MQYAITKPYPTRKQTCSVTRGDRRLGYRCNEFALCIDQPVTKIGNLLLLLLLLFEKGAGRDEKRLVYKKGSKTLSFT